MEKIKEHKKSIYIVTFLFYLLFIIWFCLLSRQPDEQKVSMLGETFIAVWKYPWTWILLVMIFANVLLYIPVGALVERVTRSNSIAIVFGGLLSIVVESIQYLSARGTLDIDDIVNNIAGTVIGVSIIEGIKYFRYRGVKIPSTVKMAFIINILYCIIVLKHIWLHLFWG